MEDIYKYTRQMAIADVIPEYKPDTWVTDAYEAEKSGLELASYLAWRASYGELKPDKDRNGKTTYSASDKFRDLLNADRSLTAAQKARLEQDFTGADNPRDYSSGNAFVLSGPVSYTHLRMGWTQPTTASYRRWRIRCLPPGWTNGTPGGIWQCSETCAHRAEIFMATRFSSRPENSKISLRRVWKALFP